MQFLNKRMFNIVTTNKQMEQQVNEELKFEYSIIQLYD